MLTELVCGMTLSECKQLSANDLIEALEGLPVDKEYCAHIVIEALHAAVSDD
jgi:NifU-like protein involved in Fe-S cluster formation